MTINQNTFMFLNAGPYNNWASDDLYSEIEPFVKKKIDNRNGSILYTYKDIICPLWVKARR